MFDGVFDVMYEVKRGGIELGFPYLLIWCT